MKTCCTLPCLCPDRMFQTYLVMQFVAGKDYVASLKVKVMSQTYAMCFDYKENVCLIIIC